MRIYCLGLDKWFGKANEIEIRSRPSRFAYFAAIGTWKDLRDPCAACGWHWQTLGPPLVVQWEPSSTVVGDFSWDGPTGYTFIVRDHVAEELRRLKFECSFSPVTYERPERKRNTVPFPYRGPKMLWVQCTQAVDLDMKASRVKLESSCDACGRNDYTFRYRRIVIRQADWKGQKMFRIVTNRTSQATFITEEGLRLIERTGFSNLLCAKAGEIVS